MADGFTAGVAVSSSRLVLFSVLTLIPQLYMSRNQTGAQAQSMRTMGVVMTIMMLFVGWGLPAGVLLYYDVSTLVAGYPADLRNAEGHRQG